METIIIPKKLKGTFENIFLSTLTGFILLELVKLGLKHLAGAIQCTLKISHYGRS